MVFTEQTGIIFDVRGHSEEMQALGSGRAITGTLSFITGMIPGMQRSPKTKASPASPAQGSIKPACQLVKSSKPRNTICCWSHKHLADAVVHAIHEHGGRFSAEKGHTCREEQEEDWGVKTPTSFARGTFVGPPKPGVEVPCELASPAGQVGPPFSNCGLS